MLDAHEAQVGAEDTREVARPVVREQRRAVPERHLRHARLLHRLLDDLDERAGGHVRLQAPGQDEAAVVVQDGHQVVVAPAHHLQVGAVGGPHLVGPARLAPVLLLGGEAYDLCRLDEAVAPEQSVAGRLRDGESARIGQSESQLPGAELRRRPGQAEHCLLLLRPQLVPGTPRHLLLDHVLASS